MTRLAPWLALLVAALLGWRLVSSHLRDDGALRERMKAREHVIAVLATQHRTDTLRLVTTRHRTDSILSTDTVFSRDTVVKLVQAERLACDLLTGTCEKEKATLREQITDLEKSRRGFRFLGVPLGCTAGAVASPRGIAPGVGCGIWVGP